jgi:hypothetical protein
MGHLGAGAPSSLPCAGSAPVTCRLEAWLPLRKSPCSPHRLISSPAYDAPPHIGATPPAVAWASVCRVPRQPSAHPGPAVQPRLDGQHSSHTPSWGIASFESPRQHEDLDARSSVMWALPKPQTPGNDDAHTSAGAMDPTLQPRALKASGEMRIICGTPLALYAARSLSCPFVSCLQTLTPSS